MKRILFTLLLTGIARAQEPTSPDILPPSDTAPPATAPPSSATPPSVPQEPAPPVLMPRAPSPDFRLRLQAEINRQLRDDFDLLERRGHRNKIVGMVLMGIGTALQVGGLAMFLATLSTSDPSVGIGSVGELILIAGFGATMTGVGYYVVGGVQVSAAQRLVGRLSLTPLIGGGGATYRWYF